MEKEEIVEAVKANKGKVIKKALIIGGTIAGLAIVLLTAAKIGNNEETEPEESDDQPNEPEIHEVTASEVQE